MEFCWHHFFTIKSLSIDIAWDNFKQILLCRSVRLLESVGIFVNTSDVEMPANQALTQTYVFHVTPNVYFAYLFYNYSFMTAIFKLLVMWLRLRGQFTNLWITAITTRVIIDHHSLSKSMRKGIIFHYLKGLWSDFREIAYVIPCINT